MSEPNHRDIDCPDCHATPFDMDERVITGTVDGATTETWHTKDCPRYDAPPETQTTEHGQLTWGPGNPPREGRPTYLRPVRPGEEPTT